MVSPLFDGFADTIADLLGEPVDAVTYRAAGGSPVAVRAIVQRRPTLTFGNDNAGVETDTVTASVLVSEVPAPAHGDHVSIAGVGYRVARIDPLPSGFSVLTLVEA